MKKGKVIKHTVISVSVKLDYLTSKYNKILKMYYQMEEFLDEIEGRLDKIEEKLR